MRETRERFDRNLHWFAVATAFFTFLLLIAGGLVTSTGSGLAVPDWPLSYGQLMPPMVGGILYEHSHRLVATFVGLLTIILAVLLWRRERRRWVRNLGLIALGAVVTQGLLGGITVILMLPTPVSVGHATLAQTFFCIVVSIAFITSRWWWTEQPSLKERNGISLFALSVATFAAIYLQLILGALMRHTQSGLAIPDFPLAYGQVFPSLTSASVSGYNEQLLRSDLRLAADDPVTSTQIILHLLHRYWAVVVAALVFWTSVRLRKLSYHSRRFLAFSNLLLGILLVQIGLGAWSVLSRKAVEITTAHVATGALLLAICTLMVLHIARISGVRIREHPPTPLEREAAA